MINDNETIDYLSELDIKIIQKSKGYRFGIDAILLANFINIPYQGKIVDLGSGSGIIPIILAKKGGAKEIIGIEIQKKLVELAIKNVRLNNFENIIKIIHEDINNVSNILSFQSIDLVVTNPPYRKLRSGRINPSDEKAIAKHEIKASLDDILNVAKYLLKPFGKLCMIYPAIRMTDLIYKLREKGIEPKKIQIAYPDKDSPGRLVLVEGRKGARSEIEIHPPLFIS
jgi:tRNA1Val (adenine37-N6)-methyltransferase